MAKQRLSEDHLGEHVNKAKTRIFLNDAMSEVQHAARPEKRSLPGIFSWLIALTAGGAVAWRSLEAARNPSPDPSDAFGKPLPGMLQADPVPTDDKIRRTPSTATPEARPNKDADKTAHTSRRKSEDTSSDRGKTARSQDCPARARGAGPLLKEFMCRFQDDECMTRSQALAFIGVLSLGPVLLFALAALGFFIHSQSQVEGYVHQLVAQLLPGRQASEAANNLIAQTHILESAHTLVRGKWWAVSIGVVSLIWTAIGLFAGASDAINVGWDVRETRNFFVLRLVCFAVFLGAGVLFLLSLVPSSLPSLIGRLNLPVIGNMQPGTWWVELLGWVLAVVIDALMFSVIYKFLPNKKVEWKSALFGGLIVGALWELFKKGFAVYIAHFGNFDKLYGALGGAVLLVTWIWYSCVILLVGAILCKMYQEHTEDGVVVHRQNT